MLVSELAVLNDEIAAHISRFISVAIPSEIIPHSVLVVCEVEMTPSHLQ